MAGYKLGDWLATCDACGKEVYATSLRKRWDGFMVCREDWEPRHPQDFVRGSIDTQVPPWTRPEPSDSFVLLGGPIEEVAIAGVAETGVAHAGAAYPSWWAPIPPSTFTV